MIQNDVQHSVLIEGFLEIPALPHSNIQIMHRIASDLNIGGLTVKKVNIFEDPLIANIEIEDTSVSLGKNSILNSFRNARVKSECKNLYLYLSLTNFNRLTKLQRITYSIQTNELRKNTPVETASMNIARSIKDKILKLALPPLA